MLDVKSVFIFLDRWSQRSFVDLRCYVLTTVSLAIHMNTVRHQGSYMLIDKIKRGLNRVIARCKCRFKRLVCLGAWLTIIVVARALGFVEILAVTMGSTFSM